MVRPIWEGMMATTLFLGGIFNIVDPIIGFQLYIWMWVGIVILAGVAAILLHFAGWKPLTPLHGLYYEWKNGGNAVFIFDADLRGEMVPERIAKCIFDYSQYDYELPTDKIPVVGRLYRKIFYYPTAFLDTIDPLTATVWKLGGVNKDIEIARFLQNGELERTPSVIAGGVPVDIIIDTDNWTIRTSPQHRAVERCAKEWNDMNPDDQVHTYGKFQRYLIQGKIRCSEVQTYAICPWVRIDKALPTDIEPNEWCGKEMQMAIDADEHDAGYINSIALKILLGGLAIAVLLLGARALTWFFQ